MILRRGGDVAVGVEHELQSNDREPRLGSERGMSLLGGGVGACEGEVKEVKNESAETNDKSEFLLESVRRTAPLIFPSSFSSSLACTITAAGFLSFVSFVKTRTDPACVLATTGAAADEQLKLMTRPFPPTFRPLPTMPSGMMAPMAGPNFRGEGFVAIVVALHVRLEPDDPVGPTPRAEPRLSGLELGGDEGANGRGGRFLTAIGFDGGLLGLGDEDRGTFEGPFRIADRSVHLTLSLTASNVGFVEAELMLRSRRASKLCCTLRGSVLAS